MTICTFFFARAVRALASGMNGDERARLTPSSSPSPEPNGNR